MYKRTSYYISVTYVNKHKSKPENINVNIKTEEDADIFMKYSFMPNYVQSLLDPLKCIWPKDYTGQQSNAFLKSIKPILVYQAQSYAFIRLFQQLIDLYNKTELTSITCLSIGTIFHNFEALLLYNELYNKQPNSNKFYCFEVNYLAENDEFTKNAIKELKRSFEFDAVLASPTSNITDPKNLQKLISDYKQCKPNFILLTARNVHKKHFYSMCNEQLLFAEIIAALNILQPNGTLIFTTYNNSLSIWKQMLFILGDLFKEIIVIYPLYGGSEVNTPNVHCKHYLGCNQLIMSKLMDIVEKWYAIDKSGSKYLDYKSEELRKKYNIKHEFNPDDTNTFVTSLFETTYDKEYNEFYDLLIKKRDDLIDDLYLQAQSLNLYSKNIDMNTEFPALYMHHWNSILNNNISWAEQYGLEVQPQYKQDAQKIADDYLMEALYVGVQHTDFQFMPAIDRSLSIPDKQPENYIIDNLQKQKTKLLLYRLAGETRDYHQVQDISVITLLNKHIVYYIQHKLGYRNVSRAFVKMYEMLELYDLVNKDANILNTFHTCEAPGNFIKAIEHFCKTRTNIKKHNWNSNSLNPEYSAVTYVNKRTGRLRPEIIGDTYGYIKDHPDKWLWGADNTGNITKTENIINIVSTAKKNLGSIQLFTSDCGFAAGYRIKAQELDDMLLSLCQITIGISVLDVNGSAVFKVFLPLVEALSVSLGYLLYKLFDQFIIVKQASGPPSSSEVYFVCRQLREPISDNLQRYLFNAIDNYNNTNPLPLFPLITIEKPFLYQWEKAIILFVNILIHHIERIFFYIDNPTILAQHLPKIKENVEERGKNWVKKYNFKKI